MRYIESARLALLAAAMALSAFLGSPSPVLSASFTVDATHDSVDASPGDGVCADTGGACTLRAAVMETNALPAADEISLPARTYVLTIPGAGEDASATGDLDITDDLTVAGAGTEISVIDGGRLDRVFHVISGAVGIADVTIRNGLAGTSSVVSPCHPFPDQENGGGLCNDGGTVSLIRVAVLSNSVDFRHGNGIYNAAGMVIQDSSVRNNTGPGGGIVNDGTMTVSRTEIRDNQGLGFWNRTGTAEITDTSSMGNLRGLENWSSQALSFTGGAISNNSERGVTHIGGEILALTNVTVAANGGEGIFNAGEPSSLLVLVGSTVSDNSGSGIRNYGPSGPSGHTSGGGIVSPNPAHASLTNVTISGNGVVDGYGLENQGEATLRNVTIADNARGGIFSPSGSTQATSSLVNTLIARNVDGDCTGETHLTSLGHNLDSDGTCGLSGAGDISGIGEEAGILPLADNGGPTQTHALLLGGCQGDACVFGSIAIDAGDNATCPVTDQRGVGRPQDGDGRDGVICDIGAFELEGPPPLPCPAAQPCPSVGPVTPTPESPVPTPTLRALPLAVPEAGGPPGSDGPPLVAVLASVSALGGAAALSWRVLRRR